MSPIAKKIELKLVNRYSDDFKLKAVAMSDQSGFLIKDVAAFLCIRPFMLSRWLKQVWTAVTGAYVKRLANKNPASPLRW